MNEFVITNDSVTVNQDEVPLDEKVSSVKIGRYDEWDYVNHLCIGRQYAVEKGIIKEDDELAVGYRDGVVTFSKDDVEVARIEADELALEDYTQYVRFGFPQGEEVSGLDALKDGINKVAPSGVLALKYTASEQGFSNQGFYGVEVSLTDEFQIASGFSRDNRKYQLARELIKVLEEEKGVPVQLTVDTPQSNEYASGHGGSGREFFGLLSQRPIIVKRTLNLDRKYRDDVSLLEGRYNSIEELQRRINQYNAVYGHPSESSAAEKAHELVEKATGQELFCGSLSQGFGWDDKPSEKKVKKILKKKKITYLKHPIRVTAEGVFHDETPSGTFSVVRRWQIADISLAMME